MHSHFALNILLTDPTLPAINYTALDRCLLLKPNKQCNWLSKIFNAGNYTSSSGGETKWILVVFRDGGRKGGCFYGLLFWMNNVFFFKLQTMFGAGLEEFKQAGLLCLSSDSLLVFVMLQGWFIQKWKFTRVIPNPYDCLPFLQHKMSCCVQSVLFHQIKTYSD